MQIRSYVRFALLGTAASLAIVSTSQAASFGGWYIGIEAGGSFIGDNRLENGVGFTSSDEFVVPGSSIDYDSGWIVFATSGYDFGDWRVEGELGYRSNNITRDIGFGFETEGFDKATGELSELSLMANVLWDIEVSSDLVLSVGGGVGADRASLDVGPSAFLPGFEKEHWSLAYQGVAGLSYRLSSRLDLTLNYRYLILDDPDFSHTVSIFDNGRAKMDELNKQSITIGLTYDLSPDAVDVIPVPPRVSSPPPAPVDRQFVIFFGLNKCNITSEADAVLSEAASAAKSQGSVSIRILGHTDTSGSIRHNQVLSECRAAAAKSSIVDKGVSLSAISASGKGESELLVKTGDGVKEPQNRRATIDLN